MKFKKVLELLEVLFIYKGKLSSPAGSALGPIVVLLCGGFPKLRSHFGTPEYEVPYHISHFTRVHNFEKNPSVPL